MVLGGIVLFVVHAHHERDVFVLARSRDDDLLGARLDVALGFGLLGKESGRFDDDVNAQGLPRQLSRGLGADDLDLLAIDQKDVGVLVGDRPLRADVTFELALRRVVLEQVGKVVSRDDIAHGDDLEVLAEQPLAVESTEHQSTDASKTVDRDSSGHLFSSMRRRSAM